jgi:hypothetical protein
MLPPSVVEPLELPELEPLEPPEPEPLELPELEPPELPEPELPVLPELLVLEPPEPELPELEVPASFCVPVPCDEPPDEHASHDEPATSPSARS